MSEQRKIEMRLRGELHNAQARAEKAEAECAELGEALRLVGIAQFEANAGRLKAEEALRAAPRPTGNLDIVAYMDWFFQVRRAALSEEGGAKLVDPIVALQGGNMKP